MIVETVVVVVNVDYRSGFKRPKVGGRRGRRVGGVAVATTGVEAAVQDTNLQEKT